jgi:hypothetical protein
MPKYLFKKFTCAGTDAKFDKKVRAQTRMVKLCRNGCDEKK